ncbi:MAG TPA: enoyl-CoA hydratase-related protein [Paracoccus solventivorans]|uniref:enoyl-CoA hydratase/isomerase family protein n=1 Tax=Paracoccus solventivorans TaxID=53463 RepID=UPI002B8A67E2|nr:enoyl-CoA hydratase-related protein [Paracoccus solventivorans]HMM09130.1 enoyl-CoA hydratase-related protein [Paracoccus solventivorans]
MLQDPVLVDDTHPRVTVIRLNRPERLNAFDDDAVDAFFAALDRIGRSDASAVIVTGEGRGFCAGFDLSAAAETGEDPVATAAYWTGRQEHFAQLVTRLRALPQPVIAAVNGAACGAGLGLALGCDLRICSDRAKFNAAFIKVGMTSCDIGVSYLLPRAVGTSRAFEMMLTGRMVDADEAGRIGLVHRTTTAEGLMPAALELAETIAENGRLNTWLTKRGMWANLEAGSLAAAIELENRSQILMQGTGNLERVARARGFL